MNVEVTLALKKLNELSDDAKYQDMLLNRVQITQRAEIKDFENLVAEFRAAHNQSIALLRRSTEDQIWDMKSTLDDVSHQITQFKTMNRN